MWKLGAAAQAHPVRQRQGTMHPALLTQVAIRAAYQARVASHQIAAQVQLHNRARMSAALLALADRRVCDLSDALVLLFAVTTSSRSVTISVDQQRHILERRAVASTIDADLAAHRIAEALGCARYLKRPRKAGLFEVIGDVPGSDRHLLVALKLVPSSNAKTGMDEWWIATAYPIGKSKLRQLVQTGQLTEVGGGAA